MRRKLSRALLIAGLALLVLAAVALAGVKKGATYAGTIVHGNEPISLKVSANGKSVKVSVLTAPLYCQGGGGPTQQLTKPAAIAKNGSFKGSITYEIAATRQKVTKLYFSGKFSGKNVKGSVRSEFGLLSPEAHKSLLQCNGSTSYSAKAK
jgi:hypothetical protein